MPGLSLEFVLGRAGVDIVTPAGQHVALTFLDAPEDPEVSASSGGFAFTPRSGVRASAYLQDGRATLTLTQNTAFPVPLRVHIEGATFSPAAEADAPLMLQAGDEPLELTLVGLQVAADTTDAPDILTLLLTDAEGRLEVTEAGIVSLLSVPPFNPGDPPPVGSGVRFVVPAGRRPPEFTVGVYDDAAFLRSRPLRFGVPVVSTVPMDGAGIVSGSAESEWIRLGFGPETRTLYFKIICSKAIEVVTNGRPSALVQLNVYLPNGLDTLTPAIPVQLRASSDGSGNVAYYYGNFTFHREDTISYVDGFAYLLVSAALTMRRDLPLSLQVSRIGGYIYPPYEVDRGQQADAFTSFSIPGQMPRGIVSVFSALAAESASLAPRTQASHSLPLALGVHRRPKSPLELTLTVRRAA